MNEEIARLLMELSIRLEMDGVSFKPQAYRLAAENLRANTHDVSHIYNESGLDGLKEIQGVGESIAEKIEEYLKTKKIQALIDLRKKYPLDVMAIDEIQGIGPKMMKELYENLGIKTISDLKKACEEGKVAMLSGFREKTQQNILQGILFLEKESGRWLLGEALPFARGLKTLLEGCSYVKKVEIAGSMRRMQETIGDIDLLVVSQKPSKVIEYFLKHADILRVYARGENKVLVRLAQNIDCDMEVLPENQFGSGLIYFTGDKNHNVTLRTLAMKKGYKLNEYALFKGKKPIAAKTEAEVYTKLGLQWMPPEMRTNSGEFEVAQGNNVPELVELGDIKGDLQMHTTASDGNNTLEEMVKACKQKGYEYLGITDHAGKITVAHGMTEPEVLMHIKKIHAVEKAVSGISVLAGAEVNILPDGRIDVSDKTLSKLDYALASVHSHFSMNKKEMTERLLKAIQNPYVKILGHPTGRLLKGRPGYEFEYETIFKAAKQHHVAIEIDAFMTRLDISDHLIRLAREIGCMLVIDTDAHAVSHLDYMELGVGQARRGWCTKQDILNTRDVDEVRAWFKK